MDFTVLFRRNVATVEKMEGDGGGNLGKEQQSVVLRKGEGEGEECPDSTLSVQMGLISRYYGVVQFFE